MIEMKETVDEKDNSITHVGIFEGNVLLMLGSYKNGKPHGDFLIFSDGDKVAVKRKFINGKYISSENLHLI